MQQGDAEVISDANQLGQSNIFFISENRFSELQVCSFEMLLRCVYKSRLWKPATGIPLFRTNGCIASLTRQKGRELLFAETIAWFIGSEGCSQGVIWNL